VPRSPLLNSPDDEIPGEALFFTVEHDGLWSEDEDFPDGWYEPRAREPRGSRSAIARTFPSMSRRTATPGALQVLVRARRAAARPEQSGSCARPGAPRPGGCR
jgi:hypothetical protein